MGFPRRTLAFLKALHILICSSSGRITAIKPISSTEGCQTGMSIVGTTVQLFINDILDGVAPITVPGLPRDTNPIRGLMYADDVAVFADSEQSLLAASTAVEQWANCRVASYKYLGVLIDSKLTTQHGSSRNVVMGKAYYGLELVGGNKSHLAPLQMTINKGIRLFTGARLSTAIGPLLVENWDWVTSHSLIGITGTLVGAICDQENTINAICSGTDNDVFTLNVQVAVGKIPALVLVSSDQTAIQKQILADTQVRPKTVKQRHSFALMETLRTCGDSASLQKYVTRQFLDTSGFFKDPSFDQLRAHGTRYLMLARMDALWTARKAIQCEQVTGHRIQSGLVPAIQKSRLRLLGRALDPGVENVYTWLRGGVINGEADLDQRWLDGTVEHESMGTRHDNRALAARLADFLQVAYRQYQSTLWHNTTGIVLVEVD
ncbi:hypothetical protein BASA83_011748 [Batrachochytrium salamandrivorans]|nr:hypothetical protein BASA83_011748 [Batrachochytrium salamandrivorans]